LENYARYHGRNQEFLGWGQNDQQIIVREVRQKKIDKLYLEDRPKNGRNIVLHEKIVYIKI
jgi:hypothetical protein